MSDPRTPSRAERARLRKVCERVIATAEADDAMANAAALDAFAVACSPSVVLSLLAALDEGEQRATAFGVDQESSTARTGAQGGES